MLAASGFLLAAACAGGEEDVFPGGQPQATSIAPATIGASRAATSLPPVPSGTPVPHPGWKTVRWLNVTATFPEANDIVVSQEFWGPDGIPAPYVELKERIGESTFVIDAETGQLLRAPEKSEDRASLQTVLDTIRVSPLDSSAAPWPYNAAAPPPAERGGWGDITFALPGPASGLAIGVSLGDGGPPGGCSSAISVGNGRSNMGINACNGTVYGETARILPEDKQALDRFLASVTVAGD